MTILLTERCQVSQVSVRERVNSEHPCVLSRVHHRLNSEAGHTPTTMSSMSGSEDQLNINITSSQSGGPPLDLPQPQNIAGVNIVVNNSKNCISGMAPLRQ